MPRPRTSICRNTAGTSIAAYRFLAISERTLFTLLVNLDPVALGIRDHNPVMHLGSYSTAAGMASFHSMVRSFTSRRRLMAWGLTENTGLRPLGMVLGIADKSLSETCRQGRTPAPGHCPSPPRKHRHPGPPPRLRVGSAGPCPVPWAPNWATNSPSVVSFCTLSFLVSAM